MFEIYLLANELQFFLNIGLISFALAILDRKKIPILIARIPKGGKCMCKQQTAFRQSCYDAIVEIKQTTKSKGFMKFLNQIFAQSFSTCSKTEWC